MMQKKEQSRARARKMRQQGHSINEIYRALGISKSSASVWVRDVPLSARARKRIEARWTKGQHAAHAKRRAQTRELLAVAAQKGEETVGCLPRSKTLCQVACALLYWCEGEKSENDRAFSFANSDPNLVATFLHLLREGFDIEEAKLRAFVHLHSYHETDTQLQFWSEVTNIPLSQFSKPYRKPHTGKQVREGYAGCISIRYHDVATSRRIQGIARAFINEYGSIS